MWTGFYLTDEKWRPHSWVQHDGQLTDVTSNRSKIAFGVALTPDELKEFSNLF